MYKKEIAPEQYFRCTNGLILRNLYELEQEFEINTKGQNMENFNFHFYNNNNDYANWIDGVFGIQNLARELRNSKNPSEALEKVRKIISKEENIKQKETPKKSEEEKPSEENKEENKEEEKPKVKTIKKEEMNEQEELEKIHKFTNSSDELFDKVKAQKSKIYKKSTDLNTEIEKLDEEYSEIYKDLSEERKEGVDVFIPALRLKNVKAKIKYLRAARNPDDIPKIKKIFEKVREEIDEAKSYVEPDLKDEILSEVGVKGSKYKVKEGE